MLAITKAALDDVHDLTGIITRSWEAAYTGIIPDEAIRDMAAKRPEMFRAELSGEHYSHIARLCGAPVGLMMAMPCRNADMPDAGEIGRFYLHPDYWGKGCARELMDFALELLRLQGYGTVAVWTLEKNARARRFYEKCGFWHDGASEEVMVGKPLINIRYRLDF